MNSYQDFFHVVFAVISIPLSSVVFPGVVGFHYAWYMVVTHLIIRHVHASSNIKAPELITFRLFSLSAWFAVLAMLVTQIKAPALCGWLGVLATAVA